MPFYKKQKVPCSGLFAINKINHLKYFQNNKIRFRKFQDPSESCIQIALTTLRWCYKIYRNHCAKLSTT